MSSQWSAILDEIQANLAAVETALDDRRSPPTADAGLATGSEPTEPLPAELAPRAEILLARTRTLEARATADRDRIGTSLRALAGRHQPPGRPRTGRVVDVAG